MKAKKIAALILIIIVSGIAVFSASALVYDATKFDPNSKNIGHAVGGGDFLVELLAKALLPELAELEIAYQDDSTLFQNRYSVNGYYKKHTSNPSVQSITHFGGKLDNKSFDQNLLQQFCFNVSTQAVQNTTAESSIAMWDTMTDAKGYFAYFRVNGTFPLSYFCDVLFNETIGSGLCPPQVKWAGKQLNGTDLYFGTPLGTSVGRRYTTHLVDPFIAASNLKEHSSIELLQFYLKSRLFGNLQNADFDAFVKTAMNVDVIMMYGTKAMLTLYKENPHFTLVAVR